MSQTATSRAIDQPPLAVAHWSARQLAQWLGVGYFLLVALSIPALRLPGVTITGNEFSWERCIFTAVNAATLTGFQQGVPIDHYGPLGQAIVITLTIVGTLLSLLIGGLLLNAALRLPYTSARIVGATLYIYLMALGIGTALLLEPSRGLLRAATQAASAFGNSGLFLGRLPAVDDWRTHLVLMPLAVLGGLGVPVLLELSELIFGRRKLSPHSTTVITLLATVYLVAMILFTPWDLSRLFTSRGVEMLAEGSALALNSRTCGLPLTSFGEVSRGVQWLLIVAMLIGAAPGGAAGGMKLTAIFHFSRAIRRSRRREPGTPLTATALTWIGTYLLIVLVTLLALLATLPQMAADRLVFLAASAVGNVGLAHEPVVVTGPGLIILSAAMLVGRAAPMIVLWWLARNGDDVDVAI